MNRLRRNIGALALTSLLWLGFSQSVPAEESKRHLSIIYNAPHLTMEVRGISLPKVLREIGAKVGFSVMDMGVSRIVPSFSIKDATLEEVLRHLLSGESYTVIYRGEGEGKVHAGGVIHEIFLLSPPTHAEAVTDSIQSQGEPTRLLDASPTSQSTTSLSGDPRRIRDRVTKDETTALKLGGIPRARARPGFRELTGGSRSKTLSVKVYQPLQSTVVTAGEGLTSEASTPRLSSDIEINEALTTTTRLAEQNLTALINGLTTTESSLLQSLADKGR